MVNGVPVLLAPEEIDITNADGLRTGTSLHCRATAPAWPAHPRRKVILDFGAHRYAR
jgi:hypothetical protein